MAETEKYSSSNFEICTNVLFTGDNGLVECSEEDFCKQLSIFLEEKGYLFILKDSKIKATVSLQESKYPGRTDLIVKKVSLDIIPQRGEIILA